MNRFKTALVVLLPHLTLCLVSAARLKKYPRLDESTDRLLNPVCNSICRLRPPTQIELCPLRHDEPHQERAEERGLIFDFLSPPEPAPPGVKTKEMSSTTKTNGLQARLTKAFLTCDKNAANQDKTGSDPYDYTYYPPGGEEMHKPASQGGSQACEMNRSHLLAKMLGGSGRDVLNIVALYRNPNQIVMRAVEFQVRDAFEKLCLGSEDIIIYTVKPVYGNGKDAPVKLTITAEIEMKGNQDTTYPWFSIDIVNEKYPDMANLPVHYNNTANFLSNGDWANGNCN